MSLDSILLPSEQEKRKSGSFNTSGEAQNTKLRSLQHKYRQTVTLMSHQPGKIKILCWKNGGIYGKYF